MMKNSLKRFTAVLACTALTAALALPARAAEDQPIRVGSYKGTTLEVGERSGLVIGPGGPAYTVTSSDPDTVEVEQVMNFWTAVAKAEGSAEITVSNQTGETATLTLTVGSHAPQAPTVESMPVRKPCPGYAFWARPPLPPWAFSPTTAWRRSNSSGRGCARRCWNPGNCALKRPPSTTIS